MPRVLCFGDAEISWHGSCVSTCPFYHPFSHIKRHTLVMLLSVGSMHSKDMILTGTCCRARSADALACFGHSPKGLGGCQWPPLRVPWWHQVPATGWAGQEQAALGFAARSWRLSAITPWAGVAPLRAAGWLCAQLPSACPAAVGAGALFSSLQAVPSSLLVSVSAEAPSRRAPAVVAVARSTGSPCRTASPREC